MRTGRLVGSATLILTYLVLPAVVWAVSPPSCAITGGGAPATDCHAEFAAPRLRLNFPPYDPTAPKPRREVRCFDGDPLCDLDGAVNGECLFDVDICLHNEDPALPSCAVADVTKVTIANPMRDPDLKSLQQAINTLLPATTNVCTNGQTLRVPAKKPPGAQAGRRTKPRKIVRVDTETSSGTDVDRLILGCVRRGWTNHGYDNVNHRASPVETTLNPTNVVNLELKWDTDLAKLEGGNVGTTATPAFGNQTLFVPASNGKLYVLAAGTGTVKWTFAAGGSMQGSATLTADGRVLFGNSRADVYCLNMHTGKLLWMKSVGDAADHIWGAPTIANNRAFVGIASHTDNPCTPGRLVALDLDTGDLLWNHRNVPEQICDNDTRVACETDNDCNGGTCIRAIGAGVTATSATDASGDFVYMNSVGCYTFPSVGDSDSMFKIDAATGEVLWKNRVQPPEQIGFCAADSSIDCGNDSFCAPGDMCTEKSAYHDFGFLNGPMLIDADDGVGGRRPLVVSGSKDGTLYAFNPDNGQIVWKRVVVETPVSPGFAGFGLFNGAIAFANDTIYAALYFTIPQVPRTIKHLMAFSDVDGHTVWEDDIGISWSHVTLANGLLFAGTQAANELYIYDALSGQRLRTIQMPATVVGGVTVVDGRIYVPYGLNSSAGGVQAWGLP